MEYVSLIFVALSLSIAAFLLALGLIRLRTPSPRALRRWTWQARQWTSAQLSTPPDQEAIDEIADALSREGALRLIWTVAGAGVGAILGEGLTLALVGTLVSDDLMALMFPLALMGTGIYVGATSYVLIHFEWREVTPHNRPLALARSSVPFIPSVLVMAPLVIITAGRLLGWLTTYAYRADELQAPSVTREHPWTLWILPAILATMFLCQVLLVLRLHASMPVFPSHVQRLALASGNEWGSWAFRTAAVMSMGVGTFGAFQVNLLRLSDVNFALALFFTFYILGIGGMFLSFFLRTPTDHADIIPQPA